MVSLTGKVALITGASRGIGKATAILLAKAGCRVLINYHRHEKAAKEVLTEVRNLRVEADIFKADVSRRMEVERMVDFTLGRLGQIDILVANAGIWKYAAIEEMTEEELKETIEINLYGVFYPISCVVPHMKGLKQGNIVTISSTAGQRGEAFHSHYAATKGAIISLTKSLAPELASHNIRVNCVAPGWVDTDMSREALNSAERAKILSLIPLGRAGTAEEIAGAVLFLASDLSTFITGEILNVNGGAVLCG
jgi:3-oxoacyl-[acyl-carrier protein] reductase